MTKRRELPDTSLTMRCLVWSAASTKRASRLLCHGAAQIRRVLDISRERALKQARVTTSDHPFSAPAQRMPETCGLREIGRGLRDPRVIGDG